MTPPPNGDAPSSNGETTQQQGPIPGAPPVDGQIVDGSAYIAPPGVQHSITLQAIKFTGPLPPPEVLAAYDRLCPGAAERLLKQVEEQSAHRRAIEKQVIGDNSRDSLIGLVIGGILAATCLGVAGFAIQKGNPIVATTIVGTTVVGLAGVFVEGSRRARQERGVKRAGPPNSPPPAAPASAQPN